MKKEKLPKKEYGEEIQKLFISFMIVDNDLFARCQNIVNPLYWDEQYRKSVRFILDYSQKYLAGPTYEQVRASSKITLEEIEKSKITNAERSWFLDEIEAFCRHKALEQVILDGLDLVETGNYGEIESRIKDAMLIALQKDLGTNYFLDPKTRLMRMRDRSNIVSTGWNIIDKKLYGGFARGALNIFCGPSASGKSLWLQNLAINWVEMGLNVVYITLELSEDLISMRLDAMNTGLPTTEIFRKLEQVELKLGMKAKNSGKLCIKKLPEGGTTMNDIRAFLKEFQIQTGLVIDAVLIDYLDLIYPNNNSIDPANLFTKDKYVSEEMRALAGEMNILLASASQLGRCLSSSTLIEEESKGIIKIGDVEINDKVLSHNGFIKVTDKINSGKQKIYEITLKSGKKIRCSGGHHFPTNKGLLSIDEGLTLGDKFNTIVSIDVNFDDEIVGIEFIGIEEMIDISVDSDDHLFYANGILTHNSAIDEAGKDFNQSHIAGGISKINTADNVLGIHGTPAMRQRGEYGLQFLKVRSAACQDEHIQFSYNPESMRISDTDENAAMAMKTKSLDDIRNDLKSKTIAVRENQEKIDNNDNTRQALLNLGNKTT